MTSNSFKVIIVGGGPVGLTAAHSLSRANIDFLLLERGASPVIDAGSNLVLMPMGMRALDQLDLLNSLNPVSTPLGRIDRQDHQGRDIGDMRWFIYDKMNFGVAPQVLSRHDLTKVLYESLPSEMQEKILTSKKMVKINLLDNGVEAICADGTSYQGSVILGADGAHSLVREQMRTLALEAGSTEINDEKPFLTTYRAQWVRFPTSSAGISAGVTAETHGPKAATQLFSGEETTVVAVYERLDEPTRDRVRYTQADQVALVERWGHLPLVPGGKLSLKDAFSSRLQSGLVSLEEGVAKHWSYDGRIALLGDAAHKFTPSTGAGCNNGIIDVVALVNELDKVVKDKSSPSREEISVAFKTYQASRMQAVTAGCAGAGQATASATWQTGVHKFIDKHVLASHSVQKFFNSRMAPRTVQAPVVEFGASKEGFSGRTQSAAN